MANSRRLQVLVTIAVLVTAALVAFMVAPDRRSSPRPAREAGEPDATAVQPTVTPATTGAAPGVVPSAAPAAPPAAAPRAATPQPAPPVGHLPLRSDGGKLVDADGQEVRLTGVNWFGLETGTFAPHGLWARNWQEMLDQIAASGFNTIRLPYSNQLFDPSSKPTGKDAGGGIDYTKNPDLAGLSGLEIMDRIIAGAGQRGLTVILDRHRPTADKQSELWYTDKVPEERWIGDWVMLAKRYRGNAAVIGADLHNEPHGPATWGDGNPKTDWRLAAERAGNAILAANPDWLILVEGIEKYNNDWYWQGGNLAGARQYPVRLSHPDKLVYSPHDYGPGVWQQSWFKAPDFPANLPKVWDDHWAYLQRERLAAVLMGEFGGRSVGQDTEGTWQRSLVTFLKQTGISYTYWSWNPNSGDTGGVLKDDWSTIDQAKLGILAAYQWPKLGAGQDASVPPGGSPNGVLPAYQWPTPAATPSPPTTSSPGSTPTPHRRSPPWTMK